MNTVHSYIALTAITGHKCSTDRQRLLQMRVGECLVKASVLGATQYGCIYCMCSLLLGTEVERSRGALSVCNDSV